MKKVGILTREENLNNKKILYIPKNIYNKLNGKAQVILIPFDFNTQGKNELLTLYFSFTGSLVSLKLLDNICHNQLI